MPGLMEFAQATYLATTAMLNRTGSAARASAVKVTTTVSFPQGTDSDLADIESWLTEFDRVAAHIASGEMMAKDKCTNLVSSWGKATVAGKCLRSVQKSHGYKQLEASGQYQQAYDLLLVCLRSLAIPKKVRRRQLEDTWKSFSMHPNEDLIPFHARLDDLLVDMENHDIRPSSRDIYNRYMDLLPRECAQHLEFHAELNDDLEKARSEAIHFYE